jgi:hypothetical protein
MSVWVVWFVLALAVFIVTLLIVLRLAVGA